MPDQNQPREKANPTDDERRKAAAHASAQNPIGNRGSQVQAPAQPAKHKEQVPGAVSEQSFEHAGRAVRAQPSTRRDPANPRQSGSDEDPDTSPSEDDQRDIKADEDADPSDTSFPIDERTERKTRAQQTADEEER